MNSYDDVLIFGKCARTHALIKGLTRSRHVRRICCAPGNAGIASEVTYHGLPIECYDVKLDDIAGQLQLGKSLRPYLTASSPELPIVRGIGDLLAQEGLRFWGPNKKAAEFEGSKIFTQRFCQKYGLPIAYGKCFADAELAKKFVHEELGGRAVVKGDGLADGKGAIPCEDQEAADKAIDDLMIHKVLGEGCAKVVIQRLYTGREISLHILYDGKTTSVWPATADHKHLKRGKAGGMTGGVGAYSPVPFLPYSELLNIAEKILPLWQAGCEAEGIEFRGMLFVGIMLTDEGPIILEFNVRAGSPEMEAYTMLLETDLFEVLNASADGELHAVTPVWSNDAVVGVFLTAEGYPKTAPKVGDVIYGLENVRRVLDTETFHAGTAFHKGKIVTAGGRVILVMGRAPTIPEAHKLVYQAAPLIDWEGRYCPDYIAAEALEFIARR